MEKYLSRNLDSFVKSGCLDVIELIIVNDGSTDRTLDIAKEYNNRHKNSITIIDKSNGHYGSCVNAALKIAIGKYFRIVDADDWVNPEALAIMVNELKDINTDVVYTRYSNYLEKESKFELNEDPGNLIWYKPMRLDDIKFDKYVHMHQITYRTEFLRNIRYIQTEGVCYTDTEYVFKPLGCARDIYCLDISLYQYYIGRDDQSMSTRVLMKNFMHLHKVLLSIINHPHPTYTNANYEFLRQYFIKVLFGMLVDCLYASQCHNDEWNRLLREISSLLVSSGFDLSPYLEFSIRGCHWFRWWLEDSWYNRLKLKALFALIAGTKTIRS